MKALTYSRFGGPEVLELRAVPEPAPQANEVLVLVHAAGVNPVDWKILHGDFRWMTGARMPRRIGSEFSGRIAGLGGAVRGFAVGEAVCGWFDPFKARQGGFAECITVAAENIVRLPAGLSFAAAAVLPVAGMSAVGCLHRLGRAAAGQRVLVLGAAGGVGMFVVQLAKLHGLHVTAVCRASAADFVRTLGADDVVEFDRADVRRLNATFDLIIDAAAKFSFGECSRLLTPDGTYVTSVPGPRVLFDAVRTRCFGRRRARFLILKPTARALGELAQLAAARKINPAIGHTFPLTAARAALEQSVRGGVQGKIVVQISGPESQP
jgi:NADPH:quinone reductase-like Zn-dependent oxidoreductase